jgi:Protein of unknown function (DUF2971)
LFDYTGVNFLTRIAKTNSLWASNIYYMNDLAEVTHACDVLKNVITPDFAFGNPPPVEIEFIRQFNELVNTCRNTTYNIFVFSLSEEPSLLSQWRSYMPHGKGVSIGFSGKSLQTITQTSDLRIAKCLYERHEDEEILRSLLDKLLTTFRQENPEPDASIAHRTQSYHPFLEKFRQDLLQVLSIIRHGSFREEKEWRLISPYYATCTIPAIKFRDGASMLVPYIELPLGESKPYFESVILGPSPHQNLSMSALSMFLSNQNLCNKTENSVIPYREWS